MCRAFCVAIIYIPRQVWFSLDGYVPTISNTTPAAVKFTACRLNASRKHCSKALLLSLLNLKLFIMDKKIISVIGGKKDNVF